MWDEEGLKAFKKKVMRTIILIIIINYYNKNKIKTM